MGRANIKKQSINLLDILLFPKKVLQLSASKDLHVNLNIVIRFPLTNPNFFSMVLGRTFVKLNTSFFLLFFFNFYV